MLTKLKNFILDILFPSSCVGCQKEGQLICEECFNQIGAAENNLCSLCPGHPSERQRAKLGAICQKCRPNSPFRRILFIGSYNDLILRELIHAFKYKSAKELVEPLGILTQRLIKLRAKNIFSRLPKDGTIIVPIPLHKRRLRQRGFNQSELLAEKLAEYTNLTVVKDAVIRKRNAMPQADIRDKDGEVKIKKRKQNIKNAFRLKDPRAVKNKNIILVDDVATTCATLTECASLLKRAGAKRIWGFVVAKG